MKTRININPNALGAILLVPMLLLATAILSTGAFAGTVDQRPESAPLAPLTPGPDSRIVEDPAMDQAIADPLAELGAKEKAWVLAAIETAARLNPAETELDGNDEDSAPSADKTSSSPDIGGDDIEIITNSSITRVCMDIARNGDIYVAIKSKISGQPGKIEILRSLDGGDRFEPFGLFTALAADTSTITLGGIEIAEGSENRIFMTYGINHMAGGSDSHWQGVVWEDLSATVPSWTGWTLYSGTDFVGNADVVADDRQFSSYYLYATWQQTASGGDIWFSRSTDRGVTWESPYKIGDLTAPSEWYFDPSISYETGGYVHVVWNHREFSGAPAFDQNMVYRRAGSYANAGIGSWSSALTLGLGDGLDNYAYHIEAADNGTVAVLIDEGSGTNTKFRFSQDSGTTWFPINTKTLDFDSSGDLIYRQSTGEFIAGGINETGGWYRRGIQTAPASSPHSWTSFESFEDWESSVITLQSTVSVAIDSSRSDRIALAWNPWGPISYGTLFDAEWRSDPGYPITEFTLVLPTPEPNISATSPALLDVVGDSDLEIVFSDAAGYLHVVGSNGAELPGWPHYLGEVVTDVAVGDLDNDGSMELVTGTSDGKIHALTPDCVVTPGFPLDLGTGTDPLVSIGTTGNGSARNIIAVSGNQVFVVTYGGLIVSNWSVTAPVLHPAAIGDISGDDSNEIIVGATDGWVDIFRSGDPTPIASAYLPAGHSVSPTIGDIDSDGDKELVFGLDDGRVYVTSFDLTAHPGSWPQTHPSGAVSGISIAQVFSGGEPDVIVNFIDGYTTVLTSDGTVAGGYPQQITPFASLLSEPIAMGIDHSGSKVITGGTDGLGHVFTNLDGNTGGWPKVLGDSCEVAAAASDIDGDGSSEIVFVTKTTLEVFDINNNGPTGPTRRWRMEGYDAARTRCSGCTEVLPTEVATTPPFSTSLRFSAYPNPTGGPATFAFALPTASVVDLDVYDVSGRLVRSVLHKTSAPGEQVVPFDGRNHTGRQLAPGQYFARMKINGASGEQTVVRKFQVIR